MIGRSLLSTFFSCFATFAAACSAPYGLVSKPLTYKQDCSFENAGRFDLGSGEMAVDLGQNRVSQLMRNDSFKFWSVVNCETNESLLVGGLKRENDATSCGPIWDMSKFLLPGSELMKAAKNSLSELKEVSMLQGHEIGNDTWLKFQNDIFGAKKYSLFTKSANPFCGCKIFYPDTAGAKS